MKLCEVEQRTAGCNELTRVEYRMSKEGILPVESLKVERSILSNKDRAQPPACRGCSAYASESDSTLRNSSIDIRSFKVSFPIKPVDSVAGDHPEP